MGIASPAIGVVVDHNVFQKNLEGLMHIFGHQSFVDLRLNISLLPFQPISHMTHIHSSNS